MRRSGLTAVTCRGAGLSSPVTSLIPAFLTRGCQRLFGATTPGWKARRHGGFTFVEILASMAFLGILIPVVVSALMVSNRAAVMAERSTIAAQLGENRLNELMLADAWTSASSRGEFGPEWPGYRWEMKQADWNAGAMTELTLDVFYAVQGGEQSVRLSTLVSEALTQE